MFLRLALYIADDYFAGMAETARFIWDLEAAIDNVIELYASRKLREEGYSPISPFVPWGSYWKRRSKIYREEHDKICSEIDSAIYSKGKGWVIDFRYTYTQSGDDYEYAGGGFTAIGSTLDEALERGNELKDNITQILRKRCADFKPYVHVPREK